MDEQEQAKHEYATAMLIVVPVGNGPESAPQIHFQVPGVQTEHTMTIPEAYRYLSECTLKLEAELTSTVFIVKMSQLMQQMQGQAQAQMQAGAVARQVMRGGLRG